MNYDSSYSSNSARNHDDISVDSTSSFGSSDRDNLSDSDESKVSPLKKIIEKLLVRCIDTIDPYDSKEEEGALNYDGDNDGSNLSNDLQDILIEKSDSLEHDKRDDDDNACGYEGSDEQIGTRDTTMDQARVNKDTIVIKTASQTASQTLSKMLKKVDFDSHPCLLYRAIDTRLWKYAHEALKKSPREASEWVYRNNANASEYSWIFLPLHAACFSGAPLDLITGLAEAYPEAIKLTANGRRLPLHIACEASARSKVIAFLYNMYSDALYATDESGHTPIQKATFCESKSSGARVVKLLKSLSTLDIQGSSYHTTPNPTFPRPSGFKPYD